MRPAQAPALWCAQLEVPPQTRRRPARTWRAHAKHSLGHLPVVALEKPADILRVKAAYGGSHKPATVNRALGILRAAVNWGRFQDPHGHLAPILKRRATLGPHAFVFGTPTGEFQDSFRTAWESLLLIDYSPARLQVARVRRGVLSGGETSPIFRAVQNQGLRSALGRNFGGTGLSQGDQFRLTVVQTPDSPPASGFVDDAPPAVRALIANALALGLQLQRTPVAYGYVRASNVPPLRAADLLSTSQLKQLRVEDAPGGLRPSLERVRQQPGRFVPVTSDEYTRWAAAGARGLLVIDGQSVLEVQLFSTEEK